MKRDACIKISQRLTMVIKSFDTNVGGDIKFWLFDKSDSSDFVVANDAVALQCNTDGGKV